MNNNLSNYIKNDKKNELNNFIIGDGKNKYFLNSNIIKHDSPNNSCSIYISNEYFDDLKKIRKEWIIEINSWNNIKKCLKKELQIDDLDYINNMYLKGHVIMLVYIFSRSVTKIIFDKEIYISDSIMNENLVYFIPFLLPSLVIAYIRSSFDTRKKNPITKFFPANPFIGALIFTFLSLVNDINNEKLKISEPFAGDGGLTSALDPTKFYITIIEKNDSLITDQRICAFEFLKNNNNYFYLSNPPWLSGDKKNLELTNKKNINQQKFIYPIESQKNIISICIQIKENNNFSFKCPIFSKPSDILKSPNIRSLPIYIASSFKNSKIKIIDKLFNCIENKILVGIQNHFITSYYNDKKLYLKRYYIDNIFIQNLLLFSEYNPNEIKCIINKTTTYLKTDIDKENNTKAIKLFDIIIYNIANIIPSFINNIKFIGPRFPSLSLISSKIKNIFYIHNLNIKIFPNTYINNKVITYYFPWKIIIHLTT